MTEIRRFISGRKEALSDAGPLIDSIEAQVDAGGKRLRPIFCYWGYRSAGGADGAEIVAVGAALELLHTFAIVHDDIMDEAPERRGRPSVQAEHGPDFALLVGDLALVLADDLFMASGFVPARVAAGWACYSRMRQEVIAGQYLDLEGQGLLDMDVERARRIAVLKSGRYSVEEPLAIGASLAGADDDLHVALRRFAAPLGEAFQLRDDLLGTFGSPSSTGKSVESDIRQGKRNILYAQTQAALAGTERVFFVSRWGAGDDLSSAEIERLRALVESTGSREATERLLAELGDQVTEALGALPVGEEERSALADLARVALHRDA